MDDLKICSANVNGLGIKSKRVAIFERWRNSGCIVCLQETHSTSIVGKEWETEWGGDIIYSHGSSKSSGVAILFPPDFAYKLIESECDTNGRIICVKINTNECDYVICNVYAPIRSHKQEQLIFINNVKEIIFKYDSVPLFLSGDFNFYLNKKLDKANNISELNDNPEYREQIESILEALNLVDIWRILNPSLRRYTWHARGKASRIDYIFCSEHFLNVVDKCDIIPGLLSDHSIINVNINNSQSQRGRGYWKFNNSLLHDTIFVKNVKTLLKECERKYSYIHDNGLKWDTIKMDVRSFTIPYCIKKKKCNNKLKAELEKQLLLLQKAIDQDVNIDISNFEQTKHELEAIALQEARGVILRSKARWTEDGEKNSKYFLNLEKRNSINKTITQLEVNEKMITNPEDILKAEKDFYENLYKEKLSEHSKTYQKASNTFLNQNYIPKISIEQKTLGDAEISEIEILKNLKNMKNNKSPGSDGLTNEFYKFFWTDIKRFVVDSLKYALKHGEMSSDQKRGIISLIPKKNKVRTLLKNWRPISLLNTDYKLLTKVLAARLKTILPDIISSDQAGYLPGRFIGQNIRIIEDVLFYTERENKPGIILTIDFEKAFDSLNWNFLLSALKSFNFGENFIGFIKTIYYNIESSVTNAGHSSEFFKMQRGVRQGCPLSAYLFIIVAEIIALHIRNNDDIEGLNINGDFIKICLLADDTTCFLADISSLKHVLNSFKLFADCAGLKMNIEKTNAMYTGSLKDSDYYPHGLSWIKNLETLGIFFCPSDEDSYKFNFEKRITNLKNLLRVWKQRRLSFKGKVTIINTLALSSLMYVSSVIHTPEKVFKEVEDIVLDFFWDGGNHKVAKQVLYQNIKLGGLKLCNYRVKTQALMAAWVKRLCTDSNETWKILPKLFLNADNPSMFFKYRITTTEIKNAPQFYKTICNTWLLCYNDTIPEEVSVIQNESIWNNTYIATNRKPLYWRNWIKRGINTINDLLNEDGNFLSHIEIQNKYNFGCNFLNILQIKQSIPSVWTEKLKYYNKKQTVDQILITSKTGVVCLGKTTSKIFYNMLNIQNYRPPTCVAKWKESFPMSVIDWPEVFYNPYSITRETKLQSFQYRVIHRIIPCNKWLFNIKIMESSQCNFCDEIDTIQHFLIKCHSASIFWNSFIAWWNRHSEDQWANFADFSEIILFGLMDEREFSTVLNYLILLGKYYIYINKLKDDNSLNFQRFLVYVKSKLTTELFILEKESKTHLFDKFIFIYNSL
jgi:exonuclease III